MVSAKTPKLEGPATKANPTPAFDRLYWMRIGLAAVGGVLTEFLVGTDWLTGVSIGMAFYLLSYYAAWFGWYRGLPKEQQGKIYTTGIGGFVMVFLFTWMIFFTLQNAGY
ncbi:MAG: hypothetical protein JRN21_06225 [Nitrososphaerota archaeon]|nr:hypothetical protein [Nitrososphaerota archaeon]